MTNRLWVPKGAQMDVSGALMVQMCIQSQICYIP